MNKKIGVLCILLLIIFCASVLLYFRQDDKNITSAPSAETHENQPEPQKRQNTVTQQLTKKEALKKINLYKSVSDNSLPLEAITELSTLPATVRNFANSILENSNNIYLLRKKDEKITIIYDNPENEAHGIDIAMISASGGKQNVSLLNPSFNDENSYKTEEYDNENRLIRRTVYNDNGDIIYTEIWNYSLEDEIKYEKKDSEENIISIKKEIYSPEGNLRQEHLFYDKDGNTLMSISAAYEGANLIRFTYYNAQEPSCSTSIFNEYSNGQKIKEKVYSSELKLQNTYLQELKDEVRTSITILNNEDKEIDKLYSE